RVILARAGAAQHGERRLREVEAHERLAFLLRRGEARGEAVLGVDRELAQRAVGRRDLREAARGVDAAEVRAPALLVEADDRFVAGEADHREAELPLRLAELGRHLVQRLDPALALAVQVPPAAPVAGEMQLPRRRPLG